jgi:uncharacterized circularly permuted ATP-grasp superfamily protein
MLETRVNYGVASGYDEMFEAPGVPRAHYRAVHEALTALRGDDFVDRQQRAQVSLMNQGITFTVYAEGAGTERIFPFDIIPRVIEGREWRTIEQGLKQRILALNHFLQDAYNDGAIFRDGRIPRELVYGSTNFQPLMRGFRPPGGVWAHISGSDLVRDADGTMYVLEDNLRTPSGVSYVIENRLVTARVMSRLLQSAGVRPVDSYAARLRDVIRGCGGDGSVAVLTPGPYNSAYYEHTFLAKQMGVQLVEGRDLLVKDGRAVMKTTRGPQPLSSVYRRVDDEYLDPLNFLPDSQLGVAGLFDVYRSGRLCVINAIGNGIADDKAVYPYVPAMISYYLGEEPILPNVPTYFAGDARDREYILANVRDLVVKPTNASGGYGVVVGPTADDAELTAVRQRIEEEPTSYIAQPLIKLSTCPALIDGEWRPRRIDLRPFVLYDGVEPWVLPGGLTRVALREGSFVVNSSQGGGSKDTWVLHAA